MAIIQKVSTTVRSSFVQPKRTILNNLVLTPISGDVPVLAFDRDNTRTEGFKKMADKKPFYCYARAISKIYFGFTLPIEEFSSNTCPQYKNANYEKSSNSVPGWVYSSALFQ